MAHKTLKASAGIGETKRHDIKIVKTVVCHESCFFLETLGAFRFANNPIFKSRVEKYLVPVKASRLSDTKGMGKLSFLVTALTFLKSTQKRKLPSFFLTRTTGEFHGETDSRIISFWSISFTWRSISRLH